MLSPEELAEIMHSQSQASPAEFDAFGNAAVQPPKQQQQRGFNNQPVPQPQHQSSNPPAYSQPQGNNFRSPQNSHQGNRDNEYNGNSSEEDGGEDDHRSNDDSDSNDYNAAPPVRRPPPGNQQTNHYNGNNNNNNRYRAPSSQDDNYERPVSDRDRERDYNQFDGPLPARGNNNYPRGPRNENAPVVRGYRVRSPSQDERDNSPANNYNRPHGNIRPEQGNRYLQGGFTPVSAAGGFDGPPDRHVAPSHNNPGVRQNTRPQPAGRPSQHYYNSMHDQRPRDDRDSGDDVDDERDSYGRSPSEQRPQAAYGYYNRDEYANGSDEGEDYERRRKRRTNNSRF